MGAMYRLLSRGRRSLLASLALAVAGGGCSSEGSDTDDVPLWDPGKAPPPVGMSAPGPGANAAAPPESTEPATGSAAAPAPAGAEPSASEAPVAPDLPLGTQASSGTAAASAGGAGSDGSDDGAAGADNGAAGAAPNTAGIGGSSTASDPAVTEPDGPLARPSAVCGTGSGTPSFNLPNTLVSVPPSYDGNTPLPVVMAFHAAGNPNTQLQTILGGALQNDYIVFYPKSDGNGWSDGVDSPKVDAIFGALEGVACYDQNRVFATGHSSGSQFIVQRLCAGETRWRAIAPVASSVYCSSWQPVPALVIHGIGDTERQAYGLDDGDGLKDIVPYRTSNGCQESFTDVAVDGCTSGGVQVDPGCRVFNGCSETTQWCQHNDPQYGTSHHGVPCFGAHVIRQFFDTFR